MSVGGVVSGHTLLSHEGDDRMMWMRGNDHNDSMMSHPHSHQPENDSTGLIRDLLEQISILQKKNDEQKEIINRLSSVIEVGDIEHEVPNANVSLTD
jgi:hypothetical protein